ncbi:MAG: MFS transporter [Pseudomonadota bacterium]
MTSLNAQKTDWTLVAALFLMGLFAAAQFGKISLTLADLGDRYGTTPATTALLVSAVGSVGIVLGVVAGNLVARIGLWKALAWALAAGTALSLLQASLPPFWLMLILRVLEGFAHLAIVVIAPTFMAAAASDRDRPVAMSLWAMFFGVAFALMALVIPTLLAFGGLQLVFVLHAVGLALTGALVLWRAPKATARPVAQIGFVAAHVQNYQAARISAPGLGFVFYTLSYVALLTFVPSLYERPDFGASLPLISLLGTLAAGVLARRYRPDAIAAVGFLAVIGALALFAVNLDFALWVMFFALGIIPGACFAAIPYFNASLEERARSAGTLAQLGNVGTTLGTPVYALAISAGGLTGLWGALVVFCVFGICLIAVSARRIARQDRSSIKSNPSTAREPCRPD